MQHNLPEQTCSGLRGSISRRFASASPAIKEAGAKLGGFAQPLIAALTRRTTSPPIFDVLHVRGRDASLARIADQHRKLWVVKYFDLSCSFDTEATTGKATI